MILKDSDPLSSDHLLFRLVSDQITAHDRQRITNQGIFSWRYLVRRSARLGLEIQLLDALVKHKLEDQLPGSLLNRLRQRRATCRADNFLALHSSLELLDTLRRQGLAAVILKGLWFNQSLYSDLGARPMIDTDLLIPKADFQKFFWLMEELGYDRQHFPKKPFSEHFHYEVVFWKKVHGRAICVEGHRALCHPESFTIDEDGLWQRTVTEQIGTQKVTVLSPEDNILHLCLHKAWHGYENGLKDIVDLSRMLEQWEFSKVTLRDRARRWGCQLATWWTFKLLASTFNHSNAKKLADL